MVSNDGKYLEDLVQKWFDSKDDVDLMMCRLPDSRSARNLIQAQNADFLLSLKGLGAFHLECKSIGGKKRQLRMFKQYPLMRRWDLAGVPGFVLMHFYDQEIVSICKITSATKPAGRQYWEIGTDNSIIAWKDKQEDFYQLLDALISMLRKGVGNV
jgi:penicillin-binding protein-related factor A (putative recombinase)